MTLTDFFQELRNWFECDRISGEFTIENGTITVPDGFLRDGQFFRVIGKKSLNNGVYKYGDGDLTDEVFAGTVVSMAVPPAAIATLEQCKSWDEQYGDVVSSPYQTEAESFGDYSRSRSKVGSGQGNANSAPSWKTMFASDLNRWRKI